MNARLYGARVTAVVLALVSLRLEAQTPDQELAVLRQLLNVPETASVSPAAVPRLPGTGGVKLFLATGLDMGVRQSFLKWVEEWNRKDARKHGAVTLVANAALADVVLARYVDRSKAQTATDTALGSGVVYDPGTQQTRAAPYARQYSYSQVPVFAYVLAQTAPNSFQIVWRYATTTTHEEHKNSGRDLWGDFKNLMKKRSTR